jgi:hypothetical protein
LRRACCHDDHGRAEIVEAIRGTALPGLYGQQLAADLTERLASDPDYIHSVQHSQSGAEQFGSIARRLPGAKSAALGSKKQ